MVAIASIYCSGQDVAITLEALTIRNVKCLLTCSSCSVFTPDTPGSSQPPLLKYALIFEAENSAYGLLRHAAAQYNIKRASPCGKRIFNPQDLHQGCCAVHFSPDASHIALASCESASLWRLIPGSTTAVWKVPSLRRQLSYISLDLVSTRPSSRAEGSRGGALAVLTQACLSSSWLTTAARVTMA